MRPARAAILDFNGTVADDEALLAGIYEDLLRARGVAFEAAHYWRYAGLSDQAMFEHLFAAHGRRLEPATVDQLLRERVGRYLAAVTDEHPVADHTIAFIQTLAAHMPVGVASGAFREEIEHVLEAAGLSRLVSVIVAIDEVEAGKPDPESFTAALAHINRQRSTPIAPRDTVVFEDATDGARAARAAGMRCVALRGSAYDEDSGEAELVVDRLTVELAYRIVGPQR
jgi:HAD superfamily hydrolase (TIGR01509 family)